MKVAIISDLHYGSRSDNKLLLDYYKDFFNECLFPYLDEHQINTIIIPGDLLEKRQSINILTAKRMREDFLEKCANRTVHVIAGNHDTYFRTTNEVNSLEELLRPYPNFNVYTDPTEIKLADRKILMLPWVCEENMDRSMAAINNTHAEVCIAHLELKGLEIRPGQKIDHGLEASIFKKFDLVISGHYHAKQRYDNIQYVGSCFCTSWGDWGKDRGFHIFDTNTLALEMIENPIEMFHQIEYDDSETSLDELLNLNPSLANTYVKLVVNNKHHPEYLDQVIKKLEHLPVYNVQTIDKQTLSYNTEDDDIDQALSTLDLLTNSLEGYDIKPEFKQDLNKLLRDLYNDANTLEG